MFYQRLLSIKSLTYFLLLIAFNILNAASYTNLTHLSLQELTKISNINLSPNKDSTSQIFKNNLVFIKLHTDSNQISHIRLQQEYLGVPVMGGYAIIHNKSDKTLFINGGIYQNLESDLGHNYPFTKIIEDKIYDKFISNYLKGRISAKQITPIIYIDDDNKAFWAYKISILIKHNNSIPEKPSAIIDLKTGDILESWDDIKTIRTLVKGVGFGGNQKIGKYMYGEELDLLNISRDDFLGLCFMENRQVKVVDMKFNFEAPNAPMTFTCPYAIDYDAYWTGYSEDGFDYINGSYSPSNDAFYIGEIINKMYMHIYGVNVLTNGSKPIQLVMRVHYGKGYSNAFWDGKQMTFGDGNKMFHSLVSLGIGSHEISHGFTEQHSNLSYFGQSGGINESFSDMAAQAAEYYIHHDNSWFIGSDILKNSCPIKAIRYMNEPSLDGNSIDNAENFTKNLDVHYSSGVYNKLFYLMATADGSDTLKAFGVMLKANMDYWTAKSTFNQGACGILYAAEDLNFPIDIIKTAMDAVKVDYALC